MVYMVWKYSETCFFVLCLAWIHSVLSSQCLLQIYHLGHFWRELPTKCQKWSTCMPCCELKTPWIHVKQNTWEVYFTSTFQLYTPFLHTWWFHRLDFSERVEIIFWEVMKVETDGLNDAHHLRIAPNTCLHFIWDDFGQKWLRTHVTFLLHS
jgi:hypothetical protein